MSETAEKYGWPEIALADGTEIAFLPTRWNSETQRRDPANAHDPNHWRLFGSLPISKGQGEQIEALIARARADFSGDHRFRIVKKLLRRRLNELREKDWNETIVGDVRAWANARLDALQRGLDCCDNDRVALKGNTAQMRRYRRDKAQGCCGFHDSEEVCPVDGKIYLLGFNFGH